ncbi:bifunctional phosphoribosylaminoimidazolecarboxamide formyltransferase/IMP cyclohydrolase PurH [Brumimicrobium salinarum]|uniref:Bifunctional purine biosynthesis protein PurH n=1 Tax=Brumimicrobium salinarum TaxID=2058658 RepID=A0A2I0R5X9_9FLAO|nr:bifunctional phosphoribosylaminoimidazolecarboxamide formyltransferase/IMP cyclohydrolase [Brumimicrobium salinarum]PKR81988.1 bifunctional phosphoribosylaminoimidazolecarboxamide formyltransferase/IMP cyclohydrolase PurH [Brumimicrobium salinarum]
MSNTKIKSAIISVFNKEGLAPIVKKLDNQGVKIYSTGGTESFIKDLGISVERVEDLTSYPSILGGRVKTLHPKVFGGILNRSENTEDQNQLKKFEIPSFDLVMVDLYPFEETVANGGSHEEIIEKIDIGGISLIRAAAKNYNDVMLISSRDQYADFLELLNNQEGTTSLEQRKQYAKAAFNVSSHYDTHIFNYFNQGETPVFKQSIPTAQVLRYGENPHQEGVFYGDLEGIFDKLHGKELSYNNLLDVDAAVCLMEDFKNDAPTFAILKHNNACGLATRDTLLQAYKDALAGDPVSAFGGILIANKEIDVDTAALINDLFCEVVIAPQFDAKALEILKSKKNRIILVQKAIELPKQQFRTILNGVLAQDRDAITETVDAFETVTHLAPTAAQKEDLVFANKLVKHTKSNTIVLAKNGQLLASGTGQTSRVDALNQAIHKAKSFNFDLKGAVMASDAFFPFPDCVEIANKEGINTVVQPGGSIKDKHSIEYCDANKMAMVFTGNRHFKH